MSPKLKLFLWKIANKTLPVGERLVARQISVSILCKRCADIKTIPHLFFQYPFAQNVWRAAPFASPMETGNCSEYLSTWNTLKTKICLPPVGIVKGPLTPWILWSLWISRNKLLFTHRIITIEETITSSIALAKKMKT